MSNHNDVNDAFARKLSARGIKARLAAFYRDERLAFAVWGLRGYLKSIPGRLKASASRSLPWIAVTAVLCSMVACAL